MLVLFLRMALHFDRLRLRAGVLACACSSPPRLGLSENIPLLALALSSLVQLVLLSVGLPDSPQRSDQQIGSVPWRRISHSTNDKPAQHQSAVSHQDRDAQPQVFRSCGRRPL